MSQQQSLEEARELLRTGRYDAALARLEGCEEWAPPLNERAFVVRAEIQLRRDPIDALETLAPLGSVFASADGRFDYYIISGKAYANARNFESATQMFDLAAELAEGVPSGVATLAHHRARLRYLQGIFDARDPDFARALENPDAGARLLTLVVRAWASAGVGDYRAQIADLRLAVTLAREHLGQCDFYTLGRALHSLLRVAAEVGDNEAADDAEKLFDAIDWTPDLADAQFLCLRALAWDAFLRGDSAKAQWLLKDSSAIAPSQAWKVTAHVDRAYVARINRNEAWAADELAQAQELARGIAWGETVGEERQALVTLAALLAPSDMGRAQRFVSIYVRLGTQSLDPSLAIAHDPRAEAFSQYALGRVHRVLDNSAASAAAFEASYRIFDRADHHFRAALAAQGLFELTGAAQWQERARAHAANFPNSAFFDFLDSHVSRPADVSIDGLSPIQRQLAIAICEGWDAATLSKRFSRSEFTLQRETRALFEKLHVRSRAGLRKALEGRGLL
jgi:hypothetical protein